ncbi:hypothetical protein JOM56_013362 [Amanita muscaria]
MRLIMGRRLNFFIILSLTLTSGLTVEGPREAERSSMISARGVSSSSRLKGIARGVLVACGQKTSSAMCFKPLTDILVSVWGVLEGIYEKG